MKFILLFIALLPSTFSKKTYQFTFPESDNFPHVQFYGTIEHPLVEYTLCHWSRINGNLTLWGTIFSYATDDQYRAIGTWFRNDGIYQVDQNDVILNSSQTDNDLLLWVHSCVTSSVPRGRWNVYFNGVSAWTGQSVMEKKSIPPNGRVVLGQTLLTSGTDEFLFHHDFKGQIADLYLWDYILSPREIAKVYACDLTEEANVINWNLHSWILVNGVQVSQVNLPCGE